MDNFKDLESYINENNQIYSTEDTLDEGIFDYAKSFGKQVGNASKELINKGKEMHTNAKADSEKQEFIEQLKRDYTQYRELFSQVNKLKSKVIQDKKLLMNNYGLTLEDIGIDTKPANYIAPKKEMNDIKLRQGKSPMSRGNSVIRNRKF